MKNNLYAILFFCLFFQSCKGQIVKDTTVDKTVENIKKQPYLNHRVNCDEEQSDLLTNRICLNLAFQKADSIMRLTLDSLLIETSEFEEDSLGIRVVKMQETWRNLRDEHCGIWYDMHKGGSGNFVAIQFLSCLLELTEDRTKELRAMLYN